MDRAWRRMPGSRRCGSGICPPGRMGGSFDYKESEGSDAEEGILGEGGKKSVFVQEYDAARRIAQAWRLIWRLSPHCSR
jgi:hypothetical protein